MASEGIIVPITIEDEMKKAYIDYSMSVIISRALPDVRDGLKPVHRRVLYGMMGLGVSYNKPYKKSARIVGEVLGKYHPHGDSSVYDTMVRMAQNWSLRYPLVDGQGNYGSLDGDGPAAMRYTEARLQRIAEELLADINKDTIDYQNNFDDTEKEPSVLPGKIPNLLLNGASGIAVGMATNMLPHNLTEVVEGIMAYIDNNEITTSELMQFVKGPDFPTGGTIYGVEGIRNAFETGRGRVVIRSKTHFDETPSGREQIIVTEIPYQVNKSTLVEKCSQLINEKRIEGIADLRDESDKDGVRIVFDLKKDAVREVVLNNLFKYTQLQSSQSINNIALVKGRPMMLTLKDLIMHFVEHRHEVVVRRTQFDLRKTEEKAHIYEGYMIALDNLDEVIKTIRGAKDPNEALEQLITKFGLSERQAKAILELRLQRLTGMERAKIQEEYQEFLAIIERLKAILADKALRMQIIKDELEEIKERYGDPRRTDILMASDEITMEDMIADDEMVITISKQGYIKRTPLVDYRTQARGGVGSKGATSKDDDFTEHLFIASMHSYVMFFTQLGKVFWLKAYAIPEGSKASKGRPIQNVIQIEKEDFVRAVINVKGLQDPDFVKNHYLVMVTKQGVIKKTTLEAYSRPRQNGINAITIHQGDSLLDVQMTDGTSEIIIGVRSGRAIRFNEQKVRPMGRNAAGVRGVKFSSDDDFVVGLACVPAQSNADLLVVSENGFGKRSSLDAYRVTNRGGKGVKTMNITEKTGNLVALLLVSDQDDLMIINKSGLTIRMRVAQLRLVGRATQGVRLIHLNADDHISSVARVHIDEEEEIDHQDLLLEEVELEQVIDELDSEDEIEQDDQEDTEDID